LQRFASIGSPGAEKILLFTRTQPVLALESNGLRVLVRLGFAAEQKSYDATYHAIRQALAPELPTDFDWLIAAHQLLRQHGQELCKRTKPQCQSCPLRKKCDYIQANSIN
jgi:endonuclease III